jgi:hypothetical protein
MPVTNKVMIMAGMHRSGTSVTSQWLHKCNLHIGNNLLGPAAGNVEGHFEDADFVKAHENILKAAGLPDSGLTDIPITEYPNEEVTRIQKIIRENNLDYKEWGWKDPRTCLFLPMYLELLPSAKYLFIIRDFNSSVSSLIHRMYLWQKERHNKWYKKIAWKRKRDNIKEKLYRENSEAYLKVWIAYNRNLLMHINKLSKQNYLVTNYENLKENNFYIFSYLKNQWGFHLNYVDYNKVFKEKLISDLVNIEPYINNKGLIYEAEEIERRLEGYIAETP